ncbi:MAG: GAF domain-containing sensor histidine kinase [Alphaproteobacteria bacterium]
MNADLESKTSARQLAKEMERLEALYSFDLLDSAAEKQFDDITLLASVICECPIALVSLVDENRQWFKSKTGLDVSETPRELAFCSHAILNANQMFVVEDTALDSRFCDNDLVTADPYIRFYAGRPLTVSSGHSLGTLCVIDTVPKVLSAHQKNTLNVLADIIVNLIESRKIKAEHKKAITNLSGLKVELENFAHIAAHDLQSPLLGIENLTKWLDEDFAEDISEAQSAIMRRIRQRTSRMQGLLDSLQQYYSLDVSDTYGGAVKVKALAEEIFEDLGAPPGAQILVDNSMEFVGMSKFPIFHVFQSLIENAIMHHDKVDPNITVTMKEDDSLYTFSVKDDGPGIAQVFQEKIFTIFQTLNPRDALEASGMGLAFAKKIVQKMGGNIWVVSEEGSGSEFIFTWPKSL